MKARRVRGRSLLFGVVVGLAIVLPISLALDRRGFDGGIVYAVLSGAVIGGLVYVLAAWHQRRNT